MYMCTNSNVFHKIKNQPEYYNFLLGIEEATRKRSKVL